MRIACTVAVAALLLAAGAGCGERTEPLGASVPLSTITVQGVGDSPTVLHARPRRIAVIGDGPGQILRSIGAGDLLVGSHLDILTGPPLVSAIKALRPDLIVGAPETDSVDLDHASSATRAPVYVAPDSSILQVAQATDDLGLLSGEGVRAREQVAALQRKQKQVEARLASVQPVRVFVDTGFFETIGDRSLLGDMLRHVRGKNIAGANPETGPFDLRTLAALNPQVYLATSDSGTTLKALRANPRTRKLAAVRAGRFVTVPVRLTEPGPGVGAGLAFLAHALHPHAFR